MLALAAFGKHPGWDDHIDDLGLETAELVAVKRALYIEGIGGNLDAGAWERLEGRQRLESFHHLFLWQNDGWLVAGRLWASRDGKGRSRYPMVVCAQCSAPPLAWGLSQLFPCLETLEARCAGASTAAEVMAVTEDARRRLGAACANPPIAAQALPPWAACGEDLAQFVVRPAMGGGEEGFRRLFYRMEQGLSPRGALLQPLHIRVPACDPDVVVSATLWTAVVRCLVRPAPPLVLLWPIGRDWVDILIGEPRPAQFYCLLASREAIPLVTEVPYTLDDQGARAEALLAQWRRGDVDMAALLGRGTTSPLDRLGRIGKWFGRRSVVAAAGSR